MVHSTSPTASPQLSSPLEVSDSCTTTSLSNESLDTNESSLLFRRHCAVAENLIPPSGLPIELIDRILDLCDYSTFLSLAQANRFFNFYATEVLLTREIICWRFRDIWVPSNSQHKAQILAALNIRQFDIHALSSLSLSFDAREHLCRDVSSLTRFLRNHVISIDKLILSFSSSISTYWITNNALACRSKLVILLEAALEKGCQRIDLRGDLPNFAFSPHPLILVPRTPKGFRKSHSVWGAWWSRFYPSRQTPPPPPPSGPPFMLFPTPRIPIPSLSWQSRLSFMTDAPSLTELEMESSLLIPPFHSHTLNLLRNQSPVLRKLKIHNDISVREACFPTMSCCEELLSTISLPVLEHFAYTARSTPLRIFKLLFLFLVRHPNIQAVRFPPIPMYSEAEYPTFDTNTFLPNLKKLYAHVETISWLLRNPNTFLNLEHVSIEAKNKYIFSQYDEVDTALVILGSRMNDSRCCCKNLKLKFSVDEAFCSWLLSHVTNPSTSPIQHLKMVETLSISLHDIIAKPEAHHLDNLIAWSSLFPNLRYLILDGYFDDDLYAVVDTEHFTTSLQEKCPLLERCSVGYWDWEKRRLVAGSPSIEGDGACD